MPDDVAPHTARIAARALTEELGTDVVRRLVLTVAYLFCLVSGLARFGVVDDPSRSLASVLSPTASLLAPALPANRLWWLVMVGLGSQVAWTWLPNNADEARVRAVAYPSALSIALLGLWFVVLRDGGFAMATAVSAAVVAASAWALQVAGGVPTRRFLGRQLTQIGLAVTLGWMSVLTADSLAAALAAHQVEAIWISPETWGILATTALLGFGMALLRYLPGRLYIAIAMAWGFVWIAYGRAVGQPRSLGLAVVALVSALLVLIAGVAVFLWARGRVRERVQLA
jgi:hypothetical protein